MRDGRIEVMSEDGMSGTIPKFESQRHSLSLSHAFIHISPAIISKTRGGIGRVYISSLDVN